MDENGIVLIAGLLATVALMGVGVTLFGGKKSRARQLAQERKSSAQGKKSFIGSLFDREPETAVDRFRAMSEEQKRSQSANLRLRLTQAGMTSAPGEFLAVFYVVGAAIGIGVYFGTKMAVPAIALAVAAGFLGPRIVLSQRINARIAKFNENFPAALDAITRGVRSGMPVNETLKVVAKEVPAPVGPEMERIVASISLGQSLDEALKQLALRVPSQEVNFFRTVLSIQQRTGGNLAEALATLSGVLRERKKMKGKVRALSSEARMSAIIIGSLPFLVALLVYVLRPDYIELLFTDPTGQWMIAGGLVWMSMGVFMMRSMVRFEI